MCVNWGQGFEDGGMGTERDQVEPAGCWKWVGGQIEGESNRRDVLIEGAISGLGRSLEPGKPPETHKNDPN